MLTHFCKEEGVHNGQVVFFQKSTPVSGRSEWEEGEGEVSRSTTTPTPSSGADCTNVR